MTKFTHEERIELAYKIADYIISNNSSTRKTADNFKISNATVSALMNELLPKISGEKYAKVQAILTQNRPKTIENVEVKARVLKVANLIKQGFIVEEIANALGESINVIYEDLQTRLPRISEELYNEVKTIQKQNSISNLKQGNDIENQKRDENGRFTK